MQIIEGDLIDLTLKGNFDIVIHGCNCFNTMGKGIAKQIKEKFPEAYQSDLKTLKGDRNKLGNYSFYSYDNFYIINAYTQYFYHGVEVLVEYKALESVFKKLKKDFGNKKLRFAYPKIGCGLAGGNWEIVSKIIDKELQGENHTLVLYNGV